MEIIDDYIVEPVEDTGWCGTLFKLEESAVWIFCNKVHGYDVTFGLNGASEGYNWD